MTTATAQRPLVKKGATNIEFVTKLMDFARSGPLMQAFILVGVEKYAEQCIAAGAAKFDSAFMSGQSWIACAEEFQAEMKARQER